MNREIKVRIINRNTNDIDYSQQEYHRIMYNYFCNPNFSPIDLYEFSQFTGLLDKEGKEIWEGDILEHVTDKNTTIKEVIYDNQRGAFIMKCDKFYSELHATYGDENMYADNYIIIGNIYQNKSLLK